jgi:glucosamine-6-phosphate deaminase
MSRKASDFIIKVISNTPNGLLCFAGGNTPIGIYRNLVVAARAGRINFQNCRFVGLDEWFGMDEHDKGSCRYLLDQELFRPLGVREENICFFNGKTFQLWEEYKKVDRFVAEYGPIDLVLLGIGINGHLGFNEPGTPFNCRSHFVELSIATQTAGIKYFDQEKNLGFGITLGLQQILESKTAVLVAGGVEKSPVIKKLLNGDVTEELPATALRLHKNCFLFLDREAAG